MNTPDVSSPSRRQVLCGLVATLVAGGAVTTACSSASTSTSGGSGSQGGTTGAGTTTSDGGQPAAGGALAKVAEVPVGGGLVVDGPGGNGKILLVQPTSGQVKAFNAICPHAGVTVAAPKGATITCPGHGSQFDTSTGALKKGPATTGLSPVQVKVDGANIVAA